MEVEFTEAVDADQLTELLRGVFPPGLVLEGLEVMPDGSPKARIARVAYTLPVPDELCEQTCKAAKALMARASVRGIGVAVITSR